MEHRRTAPVTTAPAWKRGGRKWRRSKSSNSFRSSSGKTPRISRRPATNHSLVPGSANIGRRPNLDSMSTINPDGSHHVLHPADVHGRFTTARRWVAGLMIIYAALPWIPVNGAPAVFFDVETRHFHLFGLTLVAQDLWVLFFAISGL